MGEEDHYHVQEREDKIGAPKILAIILSLLAVSLCVSIVNSTPDQGDGNPWKSLDIYDIELLLIAVLGSTATVITTADKLPRLRQMLQGTSLGIPTTYILMFYSVMTFVALPLMLLYWLAFKLEEWDNDRQMGGYFLLGWSTALLINIFILGLHKYFLDYFLY